MLPPKGNTVHLAGLTAAVLADPTLTEATADAGVVPALDLTGPASLRPFTIAGLASTGRTVLAVTATAREAEAAGRIIKQF